MSDDLDALLAQADNWDEDPEALIVELATALRSERARADFHCQRADELAKFDPGPAGTPRLIPVRPCCGQRHLGAECPDGLVMCCMCFDRFTRDQLSRTEDGLLQDVCVTCNEHEKTLYRLASENET